MSILYVAAEAMELEPFARRLENVRKLQWPLDYAQEGVLDGRRVLLGANGAGPKLAARVVEIAIRANAVAELSASKLQAVVSTGFCGALTADLKVGAIVLGTSLLGPGLDEALGCEIPAAAPEPFTLGTVFSQDRVAQSAAEKNDLAATGAIAVEMEAQGVAKRSGSAHLPCYCIKVVSDQMGESFGFDLNAMRSPEGRIERARIVKSALLRPRLLPELFRLKKCAERAAEQLGDFLASCRILAA